MATSKNSPLSSKERADLKSAAHALKPIVQFGKKGVTDAVLKEVERGLVDHELIKVRFLESEDVKTDAETVAGRCSAALVGVVGNNAILFRRASPGEKKR